MGIRGKILLPFLLVYVLLASIVHFSWGPSLLEGEKENFITISQKILDTLALSLSRDILASDLAEIHNFLDSTNEKHPNWLSLTLINTDGVRIYPLSSNDPIDGEYYVELTGKVYYDNDVIATINLVVDLKKDLLKAEQHVAQLEFYTLLISAIVSIAVAIWLNVAIRQPLIHLESAALNISQGNFDIDLQDIGQQHDEIGNLTKSFVRMRDHLSVASKKLNETARDAQSKEIRQRTIVNNIADGIIILNKQCQITSLNPAAEKIFLYSSDRVMGMDFKTLLSTPAEAYSILFSSDNDEQIHKELDGKRNGGDCFPLEIIINKTVIDDEDVFITIARDISERKRVDKLKNDFISTVSHELRTPLTSIRGALGLVVGGAFGDMSPELLKTITIAEKNSVRLILLVNDILDMQKIESGELTLTFDDVNIHNIVVKAVEENMGYAEKNCVRFVVETADPQVLVNGDQHRLRQVMGNLLSNAAKFSPDGEVVTVSLNVAGEIVQVRVKDRGQGIPESFIPRLFDKFSQSDSSDAKNAYGTGLGLSITKALVESHKGRIFVETEEGVGTTFCVELPIVHH